MKKLKRRLPTLDYSTLVVALMITALAAGGIGLVRTKALTAGGSCTPATSVPVYFTRYQRWGFQADLFCTTYPNANRIDKVEFDYPRQAGSHAGGAGVGTTGIPNQWMYTYANVLSPTISGTLVQNVNENGAAWIWYLAGPNINPCFSPYTQWTFFGYRIHQFLTNSWGPWHSLDRGALGPAACPSYTH